MGRKLKKMTLVSTLLLTFIGVIVVVNAKTKITGTTPRSIHGTFYRYLGHHKWNKIEIGKHTVISQSTDKQTYKLTSSSKSKLHRLMYSQHQHQGHLFFDLQTKLKGSERVFAENGYKLTSRKIDGHTYKVIRGYQGGYGFDYIKNHQATHDYVHQADGRY